MSLGHYGIQYTVYSIWFRTCGIHMYVCIYIYVYIQTHTWYIAKYMVCKQRICMAQVKCIFMWWTPDDAFLDLSPVEIRFPRYNRHSPASRIESPGISNPNDVKGTANDFDHDSDCSYGYRSEDIAI